MQHHSELSSMSHLLSLLILAVKDTCDYIESTRIIQDNLIHFKVCNLKNFCAVPFPYKVTYLQILRLDCEHLWGRGHYYAYHSNHLNIHTLVLSDFVLYLNGNSLFVFNCVLLLLFSIMFIRFTHISCGHNSPSLYEYTMNKQLSCFQLTGHYVLYHYEHCYLCILVHMCTHFSRVYIQEGNYSVNEFVHLKLDQVMQICFPKWLFEITFPSIVYESSNCSMFSINILLPDFLLSIQCIYNSISLWF